MSVIEKAVGNLGDDVNMRPGAMYGRQKGRKAKGNNIPSYESIEVDKVGLKTNGINWDDKTETLHEFKRIKRPLINHLLDSNVNEGSFGPNFIVVTSAVPGEGKTHTSLNLAISLSYERDYDVLFVDGDTIKRDASLLLGLGEKPGLNDLLVDHDRTIDSHILQTDINKLKVLPAGTFNDHSSELLASDRMAHILSHILKAENRIVLFDAPPMLATVEASVLTRLAGQVVIVTEAAKTSKAMVHAVLEQIEGEKPVGMILNKSKRAHGEEDYSSYYGYYRK